MSRQSSSAAAVFYLLCLLSLVSLVAAQNATAPAPSNSTLPAANSTADPLADDPSSAANTISSKAALFGALIAAALFAI